LVKQHIKLNLFVPLSSKALVFVFFFLLIGLGSLCLLTRF